MKLPLGLALLLLHAATFAQSTPHPAEGPSLAPMALSLVLVLCLIGAAFWALRRAGLAPRTGTGHLRLVSQLALGPRERVVIVEMGERWWLLGVGAGGVTRLGSVAKGETPAETPANAPFGALLDKLRSGGK